MLVSFKLTAAQAAMATEIIFQVSKEKPEGDVSVWCGNLLGYQGHAFSFNNNQFLEFNPETGIVTYKGHRNPLIEDCGINVLYQIALCKERPAFPWRPEESHMVKGWYEDRLKAVKILRVCDYQTSENRMKWYETQKDLLQRLSPEGLLEEVIKLENTPVLLSRPGSALSIACRTFIESFKGIEPGTPEYRKISASGDLIGWKISRVIENILK